jgi:hypothetical protein
MPIMRLSVYCRRICPYTAVAYARMLPSYTSVCCRRIRPYAAAVYVRMLPL